MELHYTSGYHPKANSQTKCTNQTLKQYIHIYTLYQQDDWASLLPIAKFAYNNTPNESTSISPFFVNKGYHLNITVHPEYNLASDWACDFITNLNELHKVLHDEITRAQKRYKETADCSQCPTPNFPISFQAYINAEHISSTRPMQKFTKQYLGPFTVIKRIGSLSYKLDFPNYMWQIHPVFHISQLKPYPPNTIPNRTQSPLSPIEVDDETKYKVTKVLDSKVDQWWRACPLLYYVHWRGYEDTLDEFSWVLATEIHTDELVPAFHECYPHKPSPLKFLCH